MSAHVNTSSRKSGGSANSANASDNPRSRASNTAPCDTPPTTPPTPGNPPPGRTRHRLASENPSSARTAHNRHRVTTPPRPASPPPTDRYVPPGARPPLRHHEHGQPRGHRSEPDLSHSPSSFCQHAIHHDSLPSTPHRSKPSSSHLHTPPRPDQHNPWRLPSAGAPVRHHGPSQSAAMQSHKGNSSETTRENFLYCYQGGLDFLGLGNSILSPNNPWFHAGSQVAEDQTWFGSPRRNGGSSMSPTASRWRTAASVTAVPSSP